MTTKKYIITLNNINHMDLLIDYLVNCKGPVILVGEGFYLNLDSLLSQIFAKAILNDNEYNPYYLEVSMKEDYILINDYLSERKISLIQM